MPLLAQEINLLKPAQEQGVGFVQANTDVSNSSALLGHFISTILQGVMVISLLIVLTFLVWGAVEYMSSGGEKSKLETARNKITGAITGLIILASVLAIFFFVQDMLGVHILSSGSDPTNSFSDRITPGP